MGSSAAARELRAALSAASEWGRSAPSAVRSSGAQPAQDVVRLLAREDDESSQSLSDKRCLTTVVSLLQEDSAAVLGALQALSTAVTAGITPDVFGDYADRPNDWDASAAADAHRSVAHTSLRACTLLLRGWAAAARRRAVPRVPAASSDTRLPRGVDQPLAEATIVEIDPSDLETSTPASPEVQLSALRSAILAAAAHAADDGMPAPWIDAPGAEAADACLLAAGSVVGPRSAPAAPACAQYALGPLAATLMRAPTAMQQQPGGGALPHVPGPAETLARAVSARQLAALVRMCVGAGLSEVVPRAIYPVLACLQDSSPVVQGLGLAALHHVAVKGLPSDLRPHQGVVLQQALRLATGCEARVWPVCAPCCVALAAALGGADDPRSLVHGKVMATLLAEGERHSHDPYRRVPLLHSLVPMVQLTGLVTVAHFARLMPLLLGWLHALDAGTQVGAARALCAVVRVSWPRVPVHARAVWEHAVVAVRELQGRNAAAHAAGTDARAAVDALTPAQREVWEGLVVLGALLYLAGGERFRANMEPGGEWGSREGMVGALCHVAVRAAEGLAGARPDGRA
ncbi:unnamed protein product [Pedinophyceae sp. YPF-701]|nr:unnamed protein product [Pedinophyceae sp. YPF-701]